MSGRGTSHAEVAAQCLRLQVKPLFSTPSRYVTWLSGLAAVIAIVAGGVAYGRHYRNALAAVEEALAVERATYEVRSLLKDAETGQRGFLLTGQPEFLAPHANAAHRLFDQLHQLSQLSTLQPAAAKSVRRLSELARAKMDELGETIALRRAGRTGEALAVVREGRGRRLMVEALEEINRFLSVERSLLAERQRAAAKGLRRLIGVFAAACTTLVLAVVGGLWSTRRGLAEAAHASAVIQDNERALRSAAEHSGDLVRILNERAELIYVSPSCARILGFTREEMLGMAPRALLHDDDREATRLLTQRVLAGEDFEAPHAHRLRSKDGEYRWFETQFRVVRGTDGASDSIHLSSRDITERRAAAEALREQTDRLRSVLASMGDGVVVFDSTRRVTMINGPAENLIGLKLREQVSEAWAAQQLFLMDGITPCPLEMGPMARALRGESSNDYQLMMRGHVGMLAPVSVNCRPIYANDTIVGCVAVLRETTERRRIESALQESRDRLRQHMERLSSILASMGDGVVVFGLDRRVLVINNSAQRFVPWTEGDQIPKDWSLQHVFLPDGTPCPIDKAPMTRALYGEMADDARLLVKGPEGTLLPVSVNARPIYDGGSIAGCVAVLHDVTERHRFERELLESEERLRVLADASFDGIAITAGRRILDVNQTLATWVGRSREELVGSDGLFLFENADRADVMKKSGQPGTYEARLLSASGGARPVEVRGTFTNYQGQSVRIAVVRDITDRLQREGALKEQGELMRALSLRDELTGLYNRRGFSEVAEQSLRSVARSGTPACLFFADLNGLKRINDTLGHELGDHAIAAAGRVLERVFRDSDIIARLGGDEFAVLALQCGVADVPFVLARIEQCIEERNRDEARYALSISVGTALYEPSGPVDLNWLMDRADQAMYQQKRQSKERRLG